MMNAKRLRTIICVTAIATMLFSSMGIGAFATVEQGAPQEEVQAQGTGDPTDVDTGETPQGDVQEPAAPESDVNAKGDPVSVEIEVGKTETLTPEGLGEGVTWVSNKPEAATVDNQGNVTGVAVGVATITATDSSGVEVSWEVTVKEPAPTYAFESGVTSIKTVSGHQRIKVVWVPAQVTKTQENVPVVDDEGNNVIDEETGENKTETKKEKINATQYIVQRAAVGGPWRNYATINISNGKPNLDSSSDAYRDSYKTSTLWTKERAAVGVAGNTLYFEDKDVGDGLMDNATKKFRGGEWKYRIVPIFVDGSVRATCPAAKCTATAGDSCVRTSYVGLTLKVKKTLYSHDKQHKKLTLKKGTKIYTCAFGFGRYQFIHGGNMYWLNRVGTKKAWSGYDKSHPYRDEEVEYFANGRTDGLNASSTSKMIWVNTYTQRIYVFQGSRGNWKIAPACKNGWYVSTGKAKTPTIRYMDPKSPVLDSGRIVGKCKTINKKVKKRHGIPCWNCFSTWNAIHGQKKSWSIKGVPKSNGCVRNTNAHATWIYNNCPKNTRVLIF